MHKYRASEYFEREKKEEVFKGLGFLKLLRGPCQQSMSFEWMFSGQHKDKYQKKSS